MNQKKKIGLLRLESCGGCFERIRNSQKLGVLSEKFEFINIKSGEEKTDMLLIEGGVFTQEQKNLLQKSILGAKKTVNFGSCAIDVRFIRNIVPLKEETNSIDKNAINPYNLVGCSPTDEEILSFFNAMILEKEFKTPMHPVCIECAIKEIPCLLLEDKECLGPKTVGGCKILCPSIKKECKGCRTFLKRD